MVSRTAAADLSCTCWPLRGAPSNDLAQAESFPGAAPRSSRRPQSSAAAADPSCPCCPAGHPGAPRPALHQQRASWLPGPAALRAPLPLTLRGRWLWPATAEGAGAAAAPAPRRPTGPASCPAPRLGLRSSTCPPQQLGPPTAPAGDLRSKSALAGHAMTACVKPVVSCGAADLSGQCPALTACFKAVTLEAGVC